MALLGKLALAAFGIGTGLQAYSQYRQAQEEAYMNKVNQALALRYAKVIREVRSYEESLFLRQAKKIIPRQKVTIAAAGLEVSGTPLKVMKETKLRLEEQAKIMQFEKELEISGIKAGADVSGYKAGLAKAGGKYSAFSTLLTGATQMGLYGYESGWWG